MLFWTTPQTQKFLEEYYKFQCKCRVCTQCDKEDGTHILMDFKEKLKSSSQIELEKSYRKIVKYIQDSCKCSWGCFIQKNVLFPLVQSRFTEKV